MEEELLLKQPTDRRLGNENLPPGPPGADEYEPKREEVSTSKSSRRSSPSSAKRKASSPAGRRHRSPTPPSRRNRSRYSPDRRGRFDRRRSPDRDRRRSPPPRDRYRGRGSRSRSRSRSRGRGSARWSPKKKPNSPPPPPPVIASGSAGVQPMIMTPAAVMQPTGVGVPAGQYGMMQPPPQTQLYGSDAYATYGSYGVPAQHPGYAMQPTVNYNAAYPPPPNAWGTHDAYAQQTWMQQQSVPDHSSQIPQQTEQQQNNFPISSNVGNAETAPSSNEANAAHDAAVAQEAENQREELKKQRTSYVNKNSLLKKELKMLKDQRKDLNSGNAPPSPTTKGFIDENEKLQNQIIKKIATIENVIEMLTGVIGEEHVDREEEIVARVVDPKDHLNASGKCRENLAQKTSLQTKPSQQNRTISTSSNSSRGGNGPTTSSGTSSSSSSTSSSDSSSSSDEEADDNKKIPIRPMIIKKEEDDDSSPERLKHKVMESMKSKQRTLSANAQREFPTISEKLEKSVVDKQENSRFNYAFYDPEMHWCQRCDTFPKTAKDYLNHLHSIDHMEKETIPETPWHSILVEDNFPNYENAPTKRMPIRGITFFVPATAWYCKLCCIWMGDLHCASMHLKSRQHSNKYTTFLERNPNFEMNWLADRQRVLNEKNLEAAAPQITAVSTTAAEERNNKKSKKTEEKVKEKKHKKNSEKKDKKKKKKRNKKRKKSQESTSESSSSDSTSSDESDRVLQKKKKTTKDVSPIKALDNPNPAASIRVTMRKSGNKLDDNEVPPPPQISTSTKLDSSVSGATNNWNVVQEGNGKPDDAMLQQWNTVQPVISDNEKKLLEQLKGKLKTSKPSEITSKEDKNSKDLPATDAKESRDNKTGRSIDSRKENLSSDRHYRKRSRSRTRSPTRSRSRGRDWRRARSRSLRRRSRSRGRRSRSRSRGRYSPINRSGRRRRSISRSRRRRSRSRSRNRRLRRSRTRSGSRGGVISTTTSAPATTSNNRVEKPNVSHSEFRPRVPEKEKEKEKDKKSSDSKEKRDVKKSVKTTSSSSVATGKKLPFIGKMPVFKKQTTGQTENESNEGNNTSDVSAQNLAAAIYITQTSNSGIHPVPPPPPPRAPAPTAAQINMAMMEDVYGNAPPFHPEAGVIHANVDYDDLMPDPIQFVNLMVQAPPPPSEEVENDTDMLPPGIDEMETEEFVQKPMAENENDGNNLPKDLEEALNIIFPGERKPEDDDDSARTTKEAGETQIIVEEPVMQMDELYKEGIHLVTIEETSLMTMDEASRLSMNEPLVFNKAASSLDSNDKNTKTDEKMCEITVGSSDISEELISVSLPKSDKMKQNLDIDAISISNELNDARNAAKKCKNDLAIIQTDKEMPSVSEDNENSSTAVDFNLEDIPNPPAPLTEVEKKRRQEELDELAMLGIDADDMAAQRM